MHDNRRSGNEPRREGDDVQIVVEMRPQPAVARTASDPRMALAKMTYSADVGPELVGEENVRTGVDPLSFALQAAPGSCEARKIDVVIDRDENVRIVRVPLLGRQRAEERNPLNSREPLRAADELKYEAEQECADLFRDP